MPKNTIKFGVALTADEWLIIHASLKTKIRVAKELFGVDAVAKEVELLHYLQYQFKKMKK